MRLAVDRWCQIGENGKQIDVNEALFSTLRCELRMSEHKFLRFSMMVLYIANSQP